MKLRLSKTAQNDLLEIERYTLELWGEKQALAYSQLIEQSFHDLLANPMIGLDRSDLKSGYRSLVSGKHQIYYRIAKDSVCILSVMHASRDQGVVLAGISDD